MTVNNCVQWSFTVRFSLSDAGGGSTLLQESHSFCLVSPSAIDTPSSLEVVQTLFLWLPQEICFLPGGGHGTKEETNYPRQTQAHTYEIYLGCMVWGGVEGQNHRARVWKAEFFFIMPAFTITWGLSQSGDTINIPILQMKKLRPTEAE